MLYVYRVEIRDENGNLIYQSPNDEVSPNLMFKKIQDQYELTNATVIQMRLEPQDAFGERRKDMIRTYSISAFGDEKNKIVPGVRVIIQGLEGYVKHVGSGRVVVDHNHPLAGRVIDVKVEVIKRLENDMEILNELNNRYSLGLNIRETDGKIVVEGEEEAKQALKNILTYYGIENDRIQL